ncbi:MAG TPA: phosphate signaling complex protein PhoU [bacterium]|nr:phosphate signaling complex protein PhoU [bacterium]
MLEERMTALKREILGYAGLVEDMIEKAVTGLLQKRHEMLTEVIEQYEPRANALEIEMDDMCTALIAQYEPKARDLRTILMVLKMSNDFERMGDHAVNIAESGLYLMERPPVKPYIDVPRMAEVTIKMLRDSITAFVNEDAVLAKNVCERDSIVDDLRIQLLRELITYMASDPGTIERALHLIRVSGNLERIADLATNACEDVIFMVEGRVIKHHHFEEPDGPSTSN